MKEEQKVPEKTEKPIQTDTKGEIGICKYYRLFIILFSFVTSIVILQNLIQVEFANKNYALPGPYMLEIRYPPEGSGIIALAGVLTLTLTYLLIDAFFLSKLDWKKKIIPNLVFVILFVGVIEYHLTAFAKDKGNMTRPNPYTIWELIPNAKTDLPGGITINRWGMRYEDFPLKKEDNEYRFIVVGDSSAFGFKVSNDERFSNVLAKKLQEEYPNRKIRVINAAVEGYSTYQSKIALERRLMKFDPDCLIISTNSDWPIDFKADKERIPPAPVSSVMSLLYKSKIYLTLRKAMLNHKFKTDKKYSMEGFMNTADTNRVSVEDSEKNQVEMLNMLKKIGGRGIIIAMPLKDQYKPEEIVEYNGAKEKACKFTEALYVDIFNPWKDSGENLDSLFVDQVHPNAEGHRRIAERLFDEITKSGIIENK